MPKATSADGTAIAYDVVGSGPPVVIVDGAYVDRAIDTFPVDPAGRPGDAIAYALRTAVGLPEEMVAGMRGAPFWPAMEAIGHTAAYDARIMDGTMAGKPLPFARWADVTVPILVLVGGQSDQLFQTGTRAFAEGMPTATHRSFHTGADESHAVTPAALARVLEEVLA